MLPGKSFTKSRDYWKPMADFGQVSFVVFGQEPTEAPPRADLKLKELDDLYESWINKITVPGEDKGRWGVHWYLQSKNKKLSEKERDLALENLNLIEKLKQEVSPSFMDKFYYASLTMVVLKSTELKDLNAAELKYYHKYVKRCREVAENRQPKIPYKSFEGASDLVEVLRILKRLDEPNFFLTHPGQINFLASKAKTLSTEILDPRVLQDIDTTVLYFSEQQKLLACKVELDITLTSWELTKVRVEEVAEQLREKEVEIKELSVQISSRDLIIADLTSNIHQLNLSHEKLLATQHALLIKVQKWKKRAKEVSIKANADVYKDPKKDDPDYSALITDMKFFEALTTVNNEIEEVKAANKRSFFEISQISTESSNKVSKLEIKYEELEGMNKEIEQLKIDLNELKSADKGTRNDLLETQILTIQGENEKFKAFQNYMEFKVMDLSKQMQSDLRESGKQNKERLKQLNEIHDGFKKIATAQEDAEKTILRLNLLIESGVLVSKKIQDDVEETRRRLTAKVLKEKEIPLKKSIGVGRQNEMKQEINRVWLDLAECLGGDSSWFGQSHISVVKPMPYNNSFTTEQWQLQKAINSKFWYQQQAKEFINQFKTSIT